LATQPRASTHRSLSVRLAADKGKGLRNFPIAQTLLVLRTHSINFFPIWTVLQEDNKAKETLAVDGLASYVNAAGRGERKHSPSLAKFLAKQ